MGRGVKERKNKNTEKHLKKKKERKERILGEE